MSDRLLKYGIASYVSEQILIVPFQTDFYQEVIVALREEILQKLQSTPDLQGLIIDLSQVKLLDLNDMEVLEQTVRMASIFGVMTLLVGLRPDVAMTLVQLGYEGKINTALTITQAIEKINHETRAKLMCMDDALFDVDEEASEEDVFEDDA